MEIKELSFMENLSEEGQDTSAMDNVVGGHGYGHGYGFHGYFPHPYFVKVPDFGKGKGVTKPESAGFFATTAAFAGQGGATFPGR